MTIKIGDAAVGQELEIGKRRYVTTRYVRSGQRADELALRRAGGAYTDPMNEPRYILEEVVARGYFYHYFPRDYLPSVRRLHDARAVLLRQLEQIEALKRIGFRA